MTDVRRRASGTHVGARFLHAAALERAGVRTAANAAARWRDGAVAVRVLPSRETVGALFGDFLGISFRPGLRFRVTHPARALPQPRAGARAAIQSICAPITRSRSRSFIVS